MVKTFFYHKNLFIYLIRYLERRRESADLGVFDHSATLMEGRDKIRSMIDVTYTMKNMDTFSKCLYRCMMYRQQLVSITLLFPVHNVKLVPSWTSQ